MQTVRGASEVQVLRDGDEASPAEIAHRFLQRLREFSAEGTLREYQPGHRRARVVAAGLVDRVQVTLFPVITGRNGSDAIFEGAADFDLELIESRTLDGNIQELTYRPTLHV